MELTNEELEFVLELLYENEWQYTGALSDGECPGCHETIKYTRNATIGGHSEDCILVNLIGKLEGM